MTKNTDNLVAYKREQSATKVMAVKKAIDEILSIGGYINITQVSSRAKVSRRFIYSKPELMELIDANRSNPKWINPELGLDQSNVVRKYESLISKYETVKIRYKESIQKISKLEEEISILKHYIEKLESDLRKQRL